MEPQLIGSLLAAGAVTTLSGLKGIETENIYRALIFLFIGVVAGLLFLGFGTEGSGIENQMTVIWVAIATALGSGLTVLFVQSEPGKEVEQ